MNAATADTKPMSGAVLVAGKCAAFCRKNAGILAVFALNTSYKIDNFADNFRLTASIRRG